MRGERVTQLRALGGLKLEPASFTQPKPLLLLTYLALEGAQQRRHLAELFWPEGRSMKSLSMTLTRLRQGAPELVAADEKRAWTFAPSDAGELLKALDKSEWRQADELYSGAFLEGVVLEDWSSELEEWVYTTREYLAERVQHALLTLAEEAAHARDFETAAKLAERVYKLSGAPAAEVSVLKRLYTLLAAGQNLHAPEVRKELDSYDVKLSLSTEAARAAFQPLGTVPHTLGLRSTSFVGREAELREVAARLAQPTCRLLTLLGPGGVGKTRLALQAAERELKQGNYPEGVYPVMLEALSNAEHLFSHLSLALGLPRASDPLAQLAETIADKRMLLVLDNFEHLAEAASLLEELLERCPNLKLLVTSRERLKLQAEWLFPVEGLSFPESPHPPLLRGALERSDERGDWGVVEHSDNRGDSWADYDAVRLFIERARQLKPDLRLEAELPGILDLCRRLEGSPLGLELAAGWVRLMSCADIDAELEHNLDFLTSTVRSAPERHRSLRGMFEASWRLLSAKEQDVLCKLSVFRGGFRREAAAYVAGATLNVLAQLVDKSLLRVLPNGRYDRHPLLHQYMREKLAADPREQQAARDAHLRYFLGVLERQSELLGKGRHQEVIRALSEEWENVEDTLERVLTEKNLAALHQVVNLMHVSFEVRGAHQAGLDFLERALGTLGEAVLEERALLGRARLERAWYLYRLGRYAEAEKAVRDGLERLPPSGQEPARARGLVTLSALAVQAGRRREAQGSLEQALALARQGQDEDYSAVVLGNLAGVFHELGESEQAEARYGEALAIHRRRGAVNHLIRESNNLANLYFSQNDLAKAEALWQDALQQARALDYKQTLPHLLTNLSNAFERRGDLEGATALNLEALDLVRETGQGEIQITILNNLASLAASQNDFGEALAYSREAVRLGQALTAMPKLMQALLARGELALKMNDARLAVQLISFVAEHPATVSYERRSAQSLLDDLQKLSLASAARPPARSASLDALIAAALGETPIA